MINFLIFIWIFIIPIADFIWEIFYKKERISYKLEKLEIQKLKKYFWGSVPMGILVLSFSLLALDNFDFSKFKNSLYMFFHHTHMLIFWEVVFFDLMSFNFLYRKSYSFLPKKNAGFLFMWKNWGWYKAYLMFNPIYFLGYLVATICFAVTLSTFVSKIFILTYPFCVYYRTKDLYAVFLFCQQEHHKKKCKSDTSVKKGRN